MKLCPSLVGRRFGKLIVLSQEVTDFRGRRQSVCHCLCDCGRECDVIASKLCKKDGTAPAKQVISCGCAGTLGDLSGKRFGKLTVLRRRGKNNRGEITWYCLCDCGNDKVVSGSQLKSGYVKSCGCAAEKIRANIASYATVAASASHRAEANRKRIQTKFDDPGSDARVAWGKKLAAALEKTYVRVDNVNIASLASDRPNGSNPYRGVSWHKSKKRWVAYCCVHGVRWQSGGFRTPEEAKEARDRKLLELLEITGAKDLVDKRKEYLDNQKTDKEIKL